MGSDLLEKAGERRGEEDRVGLAREAAMEYTGKRRRRKGDGEK